MQVRKACWLTSTHTQMDDVSRESHARWSEAPFPASSERKWHWTRRGREGEGVNHHTNAALHHRFLGLPDHPHCQCRLHSAPYACVWLGLCWLSSTVSLPLRVGGAEVAWLVYGRDSQKHHMKAGDPWRWFKWAPVGRVWTDLGCRASDMYAGQSASCAFPCMPICRCSFEGDSLFLQRPTCSVLTLHCVYTLRVRHSGVRTGVFVCVYFWEHACQGVSGRHAVVKVNGFEHSSPSGPRSTDNYKQDLKVLRCCAWTTISPASGLWVQRT